MTGREMQIAVERQLQTIGKDFESANKPNSNYIFYYLNKAQTDIVNQYRAIGVERNETIKSRLGSLFKEFEVDTSGANKTGVYSAVQVDIEADYWYILNESIDSTKVEDDTIPVVGIKVKSVSRDYYNDNIGNPYKKPELEVLCWSLENEGRRALIYPHSINKYRYSYIKRPTQISVSSNSELNESVHEELVERAVGYITNRFFATSQKQEE